MVQGVYVIWNYYGQNVITAKRIMQSHLFSDRNIIHHICM